ncbi:hypothetical protein [Chryseobacterium lathyri]|uniref:Uncharacterized protein n=1 Tax=Chryseobacterium lathyri TaxID=395933 RepID=A0ABT9SM08_9FLAO|nr:hypothetical protein [Chryseobacterium lathyri]MDP9960471.1 hypothetical protein [Chryseobacterium lathyri]
MKENILNYLSNKYLKTVAVKGKIGIGKKNIFKEKFTMNHVIFENS